MYVIINSTREIKHKHKQVLFAYVKKSKGSQYSVGFKYVHITIIYIYEMSQHSNHQLNFI